MECCYWIIKSTAHIICASSKTKKGSECVSNPMNVSFEKISHLSNSRKSSTPTICVPLARAFVILPEVLAGLAATSIVVLLLIALCISTGIVLERTVPGLWIVAYSALLSGSALLGMHLYSDHNEWNNPLKTIGIIGTVLLAYLLTWTEMWHDIGWHHLKDGWHHRAWGIWMDSGITLILLIVWLVAAVKAFRRDSLETITLAIFPILGGLCFLTQSLVNQTDLINALIFNGFMLFLGIMYIVLGCRHSKLQQLNGGMAVIALLLVTRFFDEDFGFLTRGMVFILLGACFLAVNLVMARKKKQLEVVS